MVGGDGGHSSLLCPPVEMGEWTEGGGEVYDVGTVEKEGEKNIFLEVVETRRVLRGRKLDGYIEDGGFKGRIWI